MSYNSQTSSNTVWSAMSVSVGVITAEVSTVTLSVQDDNKPACTMSKHLYCSCSGGLHTCNLLIRGPLIGSGALSCSRLNHFCLGHLGFSTVFIRLSDAVTVWWNLFFIQCKLVWSGLQISDAVLLLEDVCNGGVGVGCWGASLP